MKDVGDPIPVGMISMRDAVGTVYRTITPDREILEERLNPSSPYYGAFPDREARDKAHREACRSYDQAQRRANERLREKIIQGSLIAQCRDPKTGDILKLDPEWASTADFETETALVRGERQRVFFDPKNLAGVMKEIAPPDGDSAAHPGESAPAASKRKSSQEEIKEVYARRWPNGYSGRADQRNNAIRQDFKDRGLHPPADRSIQRALSGK
jgi:hypothetical protein